MNLVDLANETMAILDSGSYRAPDGTTVSLREEQSAAVEATVLYTPEQLENLSGRPCEKTGARFEVIDEKTQEAARRMVVEESIPDLVLLNFASARQPGGGFLRGARAQEEDLARSSGLYPCLMGQQEYYKANWGIGSALYSDHLIYSPNVPWFRDVQGRLLSDIYLASVISSPAPNAGEYLKSHAGTEDHLEAVLRRRSGHILSVAREQGHHNLLLGAWGCGVFHNDPDLVAKCFMDRLRSSPFKGYFDRVVFAVYDPKPEQPVLKAFKNTI